MKSTAQIFLIARAVFIELARKRALHAIALLMSLFAATALIARIVGIENAATGTFLLNLGLSLAHACAHILTLLLAAGQLPTEIENRTLYPLLAKPVSRASVLLGKWAGCALAGCIVFLALAAVAWLATPKLETYDNTALLQTVLLAPFSLALVAALALLSSLVFTRGTTLVLLALLLFATNPVIAFATHALPASLGEVVSWLTAYIPDFSKLNLITRYTDGIAGLSTQQVSGLVLYAGIFLAAALALATRLFLRRPL